MKLFPRTFFVLFLSGCFHELSAQATESSEIITVTADVIARDRSEELVKYPQTKREEYYITIDLTNTQDTVVEVAIMSCSWEDNFTIDGDSFYLAHTWCDGNSPMILTIPAHNSLKFYARLVNNKKTAISTKRSFKIGFVSMPLMDMFSAMRLTKKEKTKYKTYWTKKIDLVEKLYTYERRAK